MRSNSSRNLASSPNSSSRRTGAQGHPNLHVQQHPNARFHQTGPHEKFIAMQVMQALLFTSRISFLLYDIVHVVVRKEAIYMRLGWIFGGNPKEDAGVNSACFSLIGLFLIALIIFTFIYNYMIVHENVVGITATGVGLLLLYAYNLLATVTFSSLTLIESAVTVGVSTWELLGLLYLIRLVKHKKEVRYVQHFEKRFSVASPGVLGAGGLIGVNGSGGGAGGRTSTLPHQRKIQGSTPPPPPPAITISCGEEERGDHHGDEDDREEEEGGDKDGDKEVEEEERFFSAGEGEGGDSHYQHHHHQSHQKRKKNLDAIKEVASDEDEQEDFDRRSTGSYRGEDDNHQLQSKLKRQLQQQLSPTVSRNSLLEDQRDNAAVLQTVDEEVDSREAENKDGRRYRQHKASNSERPKTSKPRHKPPPLVLSGDESGSTAAGDESSTSDHPHHHQREHHSRRQHPLQMHHHKSRDHLTVPGQMSLEREAEEAADDQDDLNDLEGVPEEPEHHSAEAVTTDLPLSPTTTHHRHSHQQLHHSSHPQHLPSISIQPPPPQPSTTSTRGRRAAAEHPREHRPTLHSRSRSDTIYYRSHPEDYQGQQQQQQQYSHHHQQPRTLPSHPPAHSHSDESLLQESPSAAYHHHHSQRHYHSSPQHHHHYQHSQSREYYQQQRPLPSSHDYAYEDAAAEPAAYHHQHR